MMTAADPANQLRLALVDQVGALDRLLARAESARALMPPSDRSRWDGPANLAFELALQSVSEEIGQATARLTEALAESRRALNTVSARV
jgi:hypothetical protein